MWEWLFERISENFYLSWSLWIRCFTFYVVFICEIYVVDFVVDRGTKTTTLFDVIFIVFNIFNRVSADLHSIPETYPVYECLDGNRYNIHLKIHFRYDLFVVSLENEVQVQWCKGNWVNPIWVKIILSNYRWKTCYVQLSEAAEMTYLTIDRKWPILRMLEIQFPFWPSLGMGSKWVNLD